MADNTSPHPVRRHRWWRWLLAALVAALTLLIALPVWLPWVLMPVLRGQGLTVADYERQGYQRLTLREVSFQTVDVEFQADRVEVQLPHLWLRDGWAGGAELSGTPQGTITNWNLLIVTNRATSRPPADTNSLARVLDQVVTQAGRFRPWLRDVSAVGGRIEFGGQSVAVPKAVLTRSGLTVDYASAEPELAGSVTLDLQQLPRLHLSVNERRQQFVLGGSLVREDDDWLLAGQVGWLTNRAELTARSAAEGWLPQALTLSATNWTVPASVTRWPAGGDWSASFALGWTNGAYQFALQAEAQPEPGTPLAGERLQLDLAGAGTLDALQLDRFDITTPLLTARLAQPLALAFDGRLLVPAAELTVDARITEQEQLPFTATLAGTVRARPSLDELLDADFELAVQGFSLGQLALDEAALNGTLRWPSLVISNFSFALPGAGKGELRGALDLGSRNLTGGAWTFDGRLPDWLLPEPWAIADVSARGTLAGVWPDLEHRTDLLAGRTSWREFTADAVTATVKGVATGTNEVHLQLRARETALALAGRADLSQLAQATLSARLDSFELTTTNAPPITLSEPVESRVRWQPTNEPGTAPRFDWELSPLQLRSGDQQLSLSGTMAWPERGQLSLSATNVSAAAFAPFWAGRIPEARLQELNVRAVWNNGPLQLTSRFAAEWSPQPGTALSLEAEARTDAQGIHFAPFIFRQETNEVLQLTGVIPVEIRPASAKRIAWREAERFNVRLATLSSEVLDRELAYWTGWEVAGARVNLTAVGGPSDLLAELDVRAASLRPAGFTNLPVELTTLSNLAFQASASRGELTLKEGRFQVAGQPARLTGRLPLDANNWSNWLQQLRAPDWRQMAGELNVPEMPVAALAPLLGEALTPAGHARLQARLETGGLLGGQLSFTNLATRPFEPAGSLRELAGEVAFEGRRATIRRLSTTLGGQRLHVTGGLGWDERGIADLAFALKGTNVALVRSADLFLRSDLDLRLQATNHAPPVLAGEVRLRESLFFQDLATLTRIDLNRPELRPPYFSIRTPPLDAWRLDLRVTGRRFLKVISPVFRGDVSSGLRLGGTLREPQASGEVTVDDGRMTFPFGTLELTRGAVRLTQTDPHRPQLDFQGQGMNFGYQLQMQLTGTADAPNLAFTSVPPLSTRQILLMLSAGEIPSGSFEFTDADKASRLGFYLGKELMSELLGQDTTEERLNIRTGEHVTSDGRLTYDVEYKLTDRFSLFGEYNRFRDYNGGLKFKVYSR